MIGAYFVRRVGHDPLSLRVRELCCAGRDPHPTLRAWLCVPSPVWELSRRMPLRTVTSPPAPTSPAVAPSSGL